MLWRQRQYFCVRSLSNICQLLTINLTSHSAYEVCPDTEPTLAGADLWPVFFPNDLPNLYKTIPNWAWDTCDNNIDSNKCKNAGFTDSSDKFYKPGHLPANGTSTLHNVGGTLSAPPSGTVVTWSQSSTTYTVTATGYDKKAVASQSEYRATATGTGAFATQTSTNTNAAVGIKPFGGFLAAIFAVGIVSML